MHPTSDLKKNLSKFFKQLYESLRQPVGPLLYPYTNHFSILSVLQKTNIKPMLQVSIKNITHNNLILPTDRKIIRLVAYAKDVNC